MAPVCILCARAPLDRSIFFFAERVALIQFSLLVAGKTAQKKVLVPPTRMPLLQMPYGTFSNSLEQLAVAQPLNIPMVHALPLVQPLFGGWQQPQVVEPRVAREPVLARALHAQ